MSARPRIGPELRTGLKPQFDAILPSERQLSEKGSPEHANLFLRNVWCWKKLPPPPEQRRLGNRNFPYAHVLRNWSSTNSDLPLESSFRNTCDQTLRAEETGDSEDVVAPSSNMRKVFTRLQKVASPGHSPSSMDLTRATRRRQRQRSLGFLSLGSHLEQLGRLEIGR